MSQEVVSYYEDFKEIEKKIWDLLTNAVKDRSAEFRTPVCICGNDQDLDGRGVVLRKADQQNNFVQYHSCLLYTSPSPRDGLLSRMPSSA